MVWLCARKILPALAVLAALAIGLLGCGSDSKRSQASCHVQIRPVPREVAEMQRRLKTLQEPEFSRRNANLKILIDAADVIVAATNDCDRKVLLDTYCSSVHDVEFNRIQMTNDPCAAIGAYAETIENACLALVVDYQEGVVNRIGMEKVAYERPCEILLDGLSRLRECRDRAGEIVANWMVNVPNRLPDVVQPPANLENLQESKRQYCKSRYEFNRQEQLSLARKRFDGELSNSMARLEYKVKTLLKDDQRRYFTPDGYERAKARFMKFSE